jgi:mannose-6-phosphate isomerase-like protein (cupin superfamily)
MGWIDHSTQEREEWRAGVTTRMRVSALNGATGLCVFEQWCAPGTGAPIHTHPVEEVLSVLSGEMEVWLGSDHYRIGRDQSVVVPSGRRHGFRNAGTATLHVHAILAAPFFEAVPEPPGQPVTRWRRP